MKKILSYALLFLFLGVGATAQTISAAGNNPVPGISKDRIAKIDAMLEEAIKAEEVPGVVALVVKDGKIVYHSAKGFADVAEGKKNGEKFHFPNCFPNQGDYLYGNSHVV